MTEEINAPLIVVGVDGSTGSQEALRWAIAQAEVSGAAVEAIMAWHLPEAYALTPRDYEADARVELQSAIEKTLDPGRRSSVTARVVPGRPGHVLVDASNHAQLLVVGRHGHGYLLGKLIGSTSEYCVHHAVCPVVVVRHP
jgi:nucleotide-binding universal stress UspA family protein